MQGDHAQTREMRQELEHQESSPDAPESTPQHQEQDASTGEDAPTRSDSEQAQVNLERMLETGEENPIS